MLVEKIGKYEIHDIETEEGEQVQQYCPWYAVTSYGKVYSFKSGKYLTPDMSKQGRARVDIYADGTRQRKYIHRMVAEMFCDNPDPEVYTVIHHSNFDRADNRADNLIWMTPEQHNKLHAAERKEDKNGN